MCVCVCEREKECVCVCVCVCVHAYTCVYAQVHVSSLDVHNAQYIMKV